jgi:hypothetical protein
MYIKEDEIRKLVRKKLVQESRLNEAGAGSAGTAAKDVASGLAATAATGVAATAGYGAIAGLAGGTGALAGASSALTSAGSALAAAGPPGWIAAGVIGLGVAAYYFGFNHADGGDISNKVLDTSYYKKMEEACRKISQAHKDAGNITLSGKWKSQPEKISQTQAIEFAERLYDATKGGTFGLGLGTDEDEIKDVLNEIPTVFDISYVSEIFEKQYKSSWTFDSNLLNVFNEELNESDFGKYVEAVIADKMNTAFITLFGETITLAEWETYSDTSNAVAKDVDSELKEEKPTDDQDEQGEGNRDSSSEPVTTGEDDPYEYIVSIETGCWLTRKKSDAPDGSWKSLGNNGRATRRLDELFPQARTEEQKENCPATGSGGGSGGGGNISRKGAAERRRRASGAGASDLDSKSGSDLLINITGPLSKSRRADKLKQDLRKVIVNTLPADKKIPVEFSIKINTGAGGKVQVARSEMRGINSDGLSAQIRKMIKGFVRTRGTIDVTIPAGDYSIGNVNEGLELKRLIKKISKKI